MKVRAVLAASLFSAIVCLASLLALLVWPFPMWAWVHSDDLTTRSVQYGPLGLLILITEPRYVWATINWPYLLLLAAVTAWLPATHLRRHFRQYREHRRSTAGRCPSCNYDLRATPNQCPECGVECGGSGSGNLYA